MTSLATLLPDVFSAREIAVVAGVRPADVQRLLARGAVATVDGRFVAPDDAVRAVRLLRGQTIPESERPLFASRSASQRSPARGLLASGALHAAVLAGFALLTMGVAAPENLRQTPMRLVFLAIPGPGGGGGGGGLRQPAPPPKAEMKGASIQRSPVARPKPLTTKPAEPEVRKTPPPMVHPVARPVEPPPPDPPKPLPQVIAPVAESPADTKDKAGTIADAADSASHGPGNGRGTGSGAGTGMGEGTGAGIGPGSGGGTGGGPYRPGAGITPPSIVREVRPDYTEEARRRGVEGDVVLEIVVRADGSVGDVKIVQGLSGGLNQRAVDAVRQWRFSPAKRFGTPVDVMVEIAVEFKLR